MLFATYTIALFCFLCWLQYRPESNPNNTPLKTGLSQSHHNPVGDAMEPLPNKSSEVDISADNQELVRGWDFIQPCLDWVGCSCNIPDYKILLESFSIRELKEMARSCKIKGYSKLTKRELIKALA